MADPAAFLLAALGVLSPHGAVVVEFPYARELVLGGGWNAIYHEHLSYFRAGPFLRLAERIGAAVTRVRKVSAHGGSLRVALRRTGGGHCPEVLALAREEQQAGLHPLSTYANFAERVNTTCRELPLLLTAWSAWGGE